MPKCFLMEAVNTPTKENNVRSGPTVPEISRGKLFMVGLSKKLLIMSRTQFETTVGLLAGKITISFSITSV